MTVTMKLPKKHSAITLIVRKSKKQLKNGKGYDLRRTSETTGIPYFYSATLYPQYIIRSALPYDVNLVNSLAAIRITSGLQLLLLYC